MAIDEAIVIACREGVVPPTLRFYTWDPSCISIGYFQKIDSSLENHPPHPPLEQRGGLSFPFVNPPFHDGSIVRRITGGRAVFHGNDLSYSVICQTQNNTFPNNLKGTYNLIADSFICGLRQLGLHPDSNESARLQNSKYQHSTLCFDTALRHEISFNGRKLIGSAQRRWPDIFLQHGSILIDEGPDENPPLYKGGHGGVFSGKNGNNIISINKLSELHLNNTPDLKDVMNAICAGFRESLNINLTEDALTPHETCLAEKLLKEKYSLPVWNKRRI